MTWRRTVRDLHPDPAHPVIVIDDTFGGTELAHHPVVSTLTLMAQGAVTTPAGRQTPVERTHQAKDNNSTTPDQLPSTGPAFPLAAGLNRFAFTGQWGIDWELYTDAAVPMQASLGNWGNKWHPSTEQGQFQRAQGKPYEERQHILRVRGQDAMRFIILPYHKCERPEPFQVAQTGNRHRHPQRRDDADARRMATRARKARGEVSPHSMRSRWKNWACAWPAAPRS